MHLKHTSKQLVAKARSRPCHTVLAVAFTLLVVPLPLLVFRQHPQWAPARTAATHRLPSAELLPHLYNAALSHFSFHEALVKDELLRLLAGSPTDSVVVVGVSFGEEVLRFARAGRRVFAFEPMPHSVDLLRSHVLAATPPLDVHLFEMAATDVMNHSASFNVTYKGKSVVVRTDRVDNHVPRSVQIAVMSVDIQGEELHAIKGASALLPQVRSLWVELKACNEYNVPLLHYLHERFVLFDFVPWGGAKHSDDRRGRETFVRDATRPGRFDAYSQWLCDVKQRHFKWLQTDVLAVRRELLLARDHDDGLRLLHAIARVHERGCVNGKCRLRELIAQ